MRVTEKAPESAQSAIAAKITAFLSRTRSPLFCELDLHPEFGVLGVLVLEFAPKADQLHPLGLAQRLIRRGCRLMSLTRFLQSGGPGESHPRAPTEPCVTVSRHTALVI